MAHASPQKAAPVRSDIGLPTGDSRKKQNRKQRQARAIALIEQAIAAWRQGDVEKASKLHQYASTLCPPLGRRPKHRGIIKRAMRGEGSGKPSRRSRGRPPVLDPHRADLLLWSFNRVKAKLVEKYRRRPSSRQVLQEMLNENAAELRKSVSPNQLKRFEYYLDRALAMSKG